MIFLEGNIGAGKSTLLKIINKTLYCKVALEPYKKWQSWDESKNILQMFYKNPKRWAYTFETYTLLTRMMEYQSLKKQISNTPSIVERSPYSGRHCFAFNSYKMGFLCKIEWTIYENLCNYLFAKHIAKPKGIIYLRMSPKTCFRRIHLRGRKEEKSISLEYLNQLHQRHDAWLLRIKNIPVLCINENKFNKSNTKMRSVELISNFFKIGKIL